MKALGLITARGGSKGIPGKNLVLLGDKPLIAWTIEAALAARGLDKLIVSTDSPEIAETSQRYGAWVPFLRPQGLSLDTSPHIDVVFHCLEWFEAHGYASPEYVFLLQPTSPFREPEDIDQPLALATSTQADAIIGVTESHCHPYLMRKLNPEGFLEAILPCPLVYPRRQDLPRAFAVNGAVYLNRRDQLVRDRSFYPGRAWPYIMPPQRSIQVDTPWDLHLARLIADSRLHSHSPITQEENPG